LAQAACSQLQRSAITISSFLMIWSLAVACNGVFSAALVTAAHQPAAAGQLRATQSEVALRPGNGTGWAHRNATAPALLLPDGEVQSLHLVAEARRHQTQSCGPNHIKVSQDVYDRIQTQFLSSHLDYSCECLEANFQSYVYIADGKMKVQGDGFAKVYDVPEGQEKAQLCAAMEYLSMFASDYNCMEGTNHLIHNDNWQEALCPAP